MPLLTIASAVASMSDSLMLHSNVFHEFQPMGGAAAMTPDVDASALPASSVVPASELAPEEEPALPLEPELPET
jgi:hypothetical protein